MFKKWSRVRCVTGKKSWRRNLLRRERRARHSTGLLTLEQLEPRLTMSVAEMVRDINVAPVSSGAANLVAINGSIYFTADDGINGVELWKTDGSTAGTVLVKDISPGISSSFPANLTKVNDTLFFTANNGINGTELWRSDGTEAGTVLVKDIFDGSPGSNPSNLANIDGTLFFTISGVGANSGLPADDLRTKRHRARRWRH